tara:strand:+ start:237 stop:422 length:186 start_codon:yes stop_codon:yes gene_type:complete
MKKKLLSLKEIHKFLIDNNLFHKDFNYNNKKEQLLPQESKKQTASSLRDKSQILTNRGEIY